MNTESGATVRRIGTNGFITSVAGGNGLGFSGDNGKATAAQLAINEGVAADASGNFYIADTTNNRIRGLATSATVNGVQSLALDSSGNVYFTDIGNQRVRKLTPVLVAASGVLNAASQLPGAVAPGEIVAINFTGIVAGQSTQVLFDSNPAPVISTQTSGQVTVSVPYEVAGQASTQLQLVVNGSSANTISVPVANAAPGIFTQNSMGTGAAAAVNADSTPNSPANPAVTRSASA